MSKVALNSIITTISRLTRLSCFSFALHLCCCPLLLLLLCRCVVLLQLTVLPSCLLLSLCRCFFASLPSPFFRRQRSPSLLACVCACACACVRVCDLLA